MAGGWSHDNLEAHHQTVSQYWKSSTILCVLYQNENSLIVFLKKIVAKQLHFLLSPLYFVLNFLMNKSSLSLLTRGSRLWTFSKIVTFMSLILCPGRLKCNPVAFVVCLLVTYCLCSLNRSCKDLSVSPMYCILQFWQDMQYIKLVDLHVTDVLMSTVMLFDVAFTLLQIWTKGQIGQLLHFFMPAIFLIGLEGPMGVLLFSLVYL